VQHGITAMRWTFDPLQLTNAHLNINKLGAVGVQYKENLYGLLGGINGSLPSDRLVVQWEFVHGRTAHTETIVVDVPPVTPHEIASSSPEAVVARMIVREGLGPRLADGWQVVAVDRHARTYTLGR
jgi:predicted GNAT superfamily acetyltransferase